MAPQVNGDSSPSSAFLSHLTSYPVVSDSISTFKSNPYGAKSISLTTNTYSTLVSPVTPYLSKPYQYLSPYVSKADSLFDSGLSTIDAKLPIIKKPTGELYADGKSIVLFPLRKTGEGKDYVLGTFNGEVKKVGGEGVLTYGKAAVGTGFVVLGDSLGWLSSFLSKKKEQGKEIVSEKSGN